MHQSRCGHCSEDGSLMVQVGQLVVALALCAHKLHSLDPMLLQEREQI